MDPDGPAALGDDGDEGLPGVPDGAAELWDGGDEDGPGIPAGAGNKTHCDVELNDNDGHGDDHGGGDGNS